jgi:hypothetical protein
MSQEQKKAKPFANAVASTPTAQTTTPVVPSAASLLDKLEGRVKVIHGANDDTFDGLVGQKVATVRASLVDAFNIPADALALVNGNQVDNNYVLQQSDVLEFIKQAGVKGSI